MILVNSLELVHYYGKTLRHVKSKKFALAGPKHAWIVKPAGRARGEGIQIMRDVGYAARSTAG